MYYLGIRMYVTCYVCNNMLFLVNKNIIISNYNYNIIIMLYSILIIIIISILYYNTNYYNY